VASQRTLVDVDGHQLSLSNLDKVLYPEAGFTKGQVIDHYARVADVMLPHIADRGITFRRFPNGVGAPSFFEKRCPSHRPDWVHTSRGSGERGGPIRYCMLDSRAALVWAANLAALEIHVPMARAATLDEPSMVVFDLDPGAPATIVECCQVAMELRTVFDDLGLVGYPKTSGSKGLQVYLPLNSPHSHEHTSSFAHAVAQLLENQQPTRVTSVMAKAARPGKVFVDWSQNSFHKTTIGVYSLRARARPTVSTPLTWPEVEAGAAGAELVFESGDVLARIEASGDLFSPTLHQEQWLPEPRSGSH
jgi:bifunctional non-homologous end joining protein LigD